MTRSDGSRTRRTPSAETQRRRNERLAAIGTLAAGLAHEIRNPLHGALLHLTVLDRAIDAPRRDARALRDAARWIRDDLERIARMTDDFVDFARPHTFVAVAVDLGALARRIAEALADDAARARVAVEVTSPRRAVVVVGDAEKLGRAALALATNGIEAMADGGGRLRLRARRTAHAGHLEIEDDGPGFPEGAPIFDAFFTTKPTGTGLGLSVAQRIVAAHGGAILVARAAGKTTFQVRIPHAGPDTVGRDA